MTENTENKKCLRCEVPLPPGHPYYLCDRCWRRQEQEDAHMQDYWSAQDEHLLKD